MWTVLRRVNYEKSICLTISTARRYHVQRDIESRTIEPRGPADCITLTRAYADDTVAGTTVHCRDYLQAGCRDLSRGERYSQTRAFCGPNAPSRSSRGDTAHNTDSTKTAQHNRRQK